MRGRSPAHQAGEPGRTFSIYNKDISRIFAKIIENNKK